MLRINLLPAYIAERKKTRNAIIGASTLVLLVLGGGLAYHLGVYEPSVAAREAEATAEEEEATRVTAIKSEAASIRTKIIPIKEKVEFVKAVQFANTINQKIYRNAARYTYRAVEYNQMAVTGNTLSMSGAVRSVADLGRMYITMFGNPDVTAVSIQGIPSYPDNQTVFDPNAAGPSPTQGNWFPVQLTATLVEPVVTPQLPASLNAAGGAGGAGGGFGGQSQGMGQGGFGSQSQGMAPRSSSGPPAGGTQGAE